ncbi:MAG TPA: prepilin-type N-terminal cleavage/methylation domain-containing protein [Thermoanaerobaculia bacterium]|nr:prepilin-type N-terminal cleavage/methylation domain-containing protein [Thermoanaerobaculia bacterium]
MHTPVTVCRRQSRRGERGFSLVEVLIAALIMLVVALAIIPLFTMAASSNLQGASSTSAANYARDRLELMWQVPFSDARLTVTAGTTVKSYEYFDAATNAWVDLGIRTSDPVWPVAAVWRRVTTVRQFNADDLTDAGALPAGTNVEIITMKEVTVAVQNARFDAPFGGGKQLTIRAYRAA